MFATLTPLLAGLLVVSCQAPGVTLHGTQEPTLVMQGQDLLLMADERQALHYRYLAAERIGAASRLAEEGDEAGMAKLLYGAVEYQNIADEVAQRAVLRRSPDRDMRR